MAEEIIIRAKRIEVRDETVSQGRVKVFDFAGAGVSAAVSADGEVATLTIAGGGAPTGPAGGELGGTYPDPTVDAVHGGSAHHDRSHSIVGTSDHTSTATSGQMLKADANGLPVDATNTDADVADAVNNKHAQSHNHSAAGDGQTVAPATALVAPNGAGGPTIDAVGKMGVDTTTRTLNFHDGTAEVSLNPVRQASFLIETPVATDDFAFTRIRSAMTIIEVDYLCVGGTNWVGQVQEGDANGLNGVDTQTTDTTASAGTNGQVTTFSNAGIDAGDYLILKTTSISGTPTSILVTIYYRENP